MKKCSGCENERPLDDFAVYNGKPWYWCRQCQRAKSKSYRERFPEKIKSQGKAYRDRNPSYSRDHSRKWRKENREKYLASMRRQYEAKASDPSWNRGKNLMRFYGITIEQYDAMYRDQCGVCAVCGGLNISGKRLCVDHDHGTGKVRGLLCSRCNSAIGLARESHDVLKKAAAYLEKHETLVATGVI